MARFRAVLFTPRLSPFGSGRDTEKGRDDLIARSQHFSRDLLQRLKMQMPGF